TWVAGCRKRTCARSSGGRQSDVTSHRSGSTASPVTRCAGRVNAKLCCTGPMTAARFEIEHPSNRAQHLPHCRASGPGKFVCKSLFALLIKNSKGYSRDVRVNMWGTSSPDDKLVTDLAKATEAIKIAARRSDRLMAGKLSPLNFGLLQQNRHTRDISHVLANVR